MRSPDHVLPLESDRPTIRPPTASDKEHNNNTVLDAAKSKTITGSRKSIVTSRYFQKKQVDINDQEDKQGKNCCRGGITNQFPETGNLDSYGNTYFKGMASKRKNSSFEYAETVSAFTLVCQVSEFILLFIVFLD